MKVLYYSTAYYALHGGSNHSKAFVDAARRNKYVDEVIVFPPQNSIRKPVSISRESGIVGSFVKKSKSIAMLRFFRRSMFYLKDLISWIEKLQPDVIVIRLDGNFRQVPKLKRKFPKLIVVTEINASPFDESFKSIHFRSVFQWLERNALQQADANFFVSAKLRAMIMRSRLDNDRDFVLTNGVDLTLFRPANDKISSKRTVSLPIDRKIIGYVGTLDLTKRMDILLEAFKRIYKIRPDVFLVIIGDGPSFSSLKEQVSKNDLDHLVLLTGKIEHSKVCEFLQAFDVAVHHAANDYMCPLKLFEYLAVQLPVVGPDTPAVREIFEDNKHLLLCRPDIESIEEKINVCLENFENAQAMAKQGRTLVAEKYSWQNNADTLIHRTLPKLP